MFSWIKNQLTWGVLLGALGIFLVSLVLLWMMFSFSRPDNVPQKNATAVFTLIPASIVTPSVSSDSAVLITETPGNTDPSENEIRIGSYVEVFDTGSAGLRIRAGAGINNFVQFIAFDNELYEIQAGPQEADGYTWFYIVSAYDQNRSGWAVQNYLKVVSAQ